MSPLWKLCEFGNLAEVREALASGEDVNSKDENNRTGLMLAVSGGHNNVVELLLDQPDVDLTV